MKDQNKTKTQLIAELQKLRKQFSELHNYDKQENKVGETYISTELEKEAILDSLLEHVVHQDKEMKILWVNKAACDSVGKSLAELVGQYCYEIWPKRSDTCPDCPVAKAMATNKPHEIEKSTPDGRDWLIRGYPVQDQNGDITGAVEVTLEITRRKKSEKVLRESEERYRNIIEQSFDGINLVNHKGIIIEWNKAQERITGLNKKDVLGKYVWDVQIQLVPKELKSAKLTKQLKQGFFQALKDKDSSQKQKYKIQEQIILSPNGDSKTVQTVSFNIFIDGEIMIGTIMRDITEMKMAENVRDEALNIINKSPAVVFLWRNKENWPVEYVTENAKSVLGFTPEDFVSGRVRYSNIIHPDDLKRVSSEVTTFSKDKKHREFVHEPYRVITKNGKILWLDDRTYIRRDESGHITHYQGIIQDITAKKQAEEILKENESRLRALVSSIDEIVFEFGKDGRYENIWVNDENLLVRPANELLGSTIEDILGKKAARPFMDVIKRVISKGFSETLEYTIDTMNGKRWFNARVNPIVEIFGKPDRVSFIARDITEQKRTQEKLRKEKEFTESVLNIQPDTFFVFDPKTGKAVRWNNAFEEVSGYSSEEIAAKKAPDAYYSVEDLEKAEQFIEDVIKGDLGTIELELICKNGNRILTEYAVSTLKDTKGKPEYLISIGRDVTERNKSKELLRKSEEKFRRIADNAPDIIYKFRISPDPGFEFISQAITKISGYAPQEYYDDPELGIKVIHPDDKSHLINLYHGDIPKSPHIVRWISKDSRTIWTEDRTTPIYNENGELVAVEGIARDITDQKEAEEKLRESEKRFRTMFETNHAIMLLIDPNTGKIEDANPAACKFYGYSRKKFVNELYIQNINTLSEKEIKIEMRNALNSQRNYFVFKHKLADDTLRDIETYSSKTIVKGRELLYSIIHDITERKKAEEALLDSEKLLRQVIDASPYTIYVKDREGRYILVNKKMAESHNTTAEKLVGRTDISVATKWLTTPEKIKKFRESELAVINKKQPLFIKEDKFTFSDGSERWYQTVKSPISLKDNPNCIMGVAVDITERKQAEEALRESEKKLALLIHNIPGMVYKAFPDWTAETISGSKELCGYSNEELISKETNWLSIIHPDDKETVFSVSSELPKENKSIVQTYRIINKEGNIRWIEDHKTSLFSNEGKFLGIDGIVLDITERKMAEERYRDLVEKAGIAIVIDDLDGKFTYFNNRFAELFGYRENEIRKKSISNLVHPDDIAEVMKTHNSRLTGESVPSRYEFRGIKKDGSVINIETDIVILKEGNSYVGTRSYLWDISERKHSEETLREQSETIRSLVETSQDWIWSIDLQGQHTYSNPAVELILGYKPNELVGKPSFDIMHEKDRQTIEAEIPRWISEKQGWHSNVIRWKHKNGSWRYLESNAVPIIDAKGEIAGFRGVDRDITERIQMEKALHESEEKYRLIVENAHDGIEITQNDRIIFANSCFAEMLGYTAEELKNVTFSQFFTIQAIEELQERHKKRVSGRPFDHQYETTFRKKDGTIIYVDIKHEIIDYKGKPATFAIIRDITEQKQAEEEKSKLETQLRRAQKLETIGTLAGGIAHDFNNILAPIMGYTDMALLNLENSDPLYSDLQHVLKGAHRAKDLVEQILLFSKQSEKERQPLALQTQVKEALKLLRPTIPTTIEIRQRIDDSCGKVQADATQIHQVIVNLCTNAWQAMEEYGGTLTIELNQIKIDASTAKLHPDLNEAEYARLSVIDTGPGIDEETLDRIFEPFFTTKSVDKGTGLGLSVIHGIVQSHRGDIHVYSEEGKGSVFHVYLPIFVPQEEKSKVTLSEIARGSELIMIVDDEMEITNLIKRMLENFGYKAEVFESGIEGLNEFKHNPEKFDLLISDLTMPQMTGLDLADQIHKVNPQFPVLIMTGFGDNITLATQKRYGIKQVIGKPIIIQELISSIRSVLDKQ